MAAVVDIGERMYPCMEFVEKFKNERNYHAAEYFDFSST